MKKNKKLKTIPKFKNEDEEKVLQGQSIGITYGKNKKKVAALVPYKNLNVKKFKLGLLEGKASFKIKSGFKMTDEEFLKS